MNGAGDRCVVRVLALVAAFVVTAATSGAHATSCGSGAYPFPFTDVGGVNDAFCLGIMEAYVLGVTKGTTATTFSPNDNVPRLQMTTFLQRSIDQGLRRNSRRMALGQWWTPKTGAGLRRTLLPGPGPMGFCKADGERIWVGNGPRIQSVQASTGEMRADIDVASLGSNSGGVLVADGQAYVVDPIWQTLFKVDPGVEAPFGSVLGYTNIGYQPNNLTFDGDRIWTANYADGTVSIISVSNGTPSPHHSVATVVGGFSVPFDVIYDGANVWVTDAGTANKLHKLNANGTIAQSVAVGAAPAYMVYDGANIWVPNNAGDSITVVQASTGTLVATIAANALNRLSAPVQAAFDGERIAVTNSGNDSVTLFRAADLSLIGNVQLLAGWVPFGVCSDGINFWITLRGFKALLRL